MVNKKEERKKERKRERKEGRKIDTEKKRIDICAIVREMDRQ